MNLFVWKIITVIILGTFGSRVAFTIFLRVMGRGSWSSTWSLYASHRDVIDICW